MVKVCLETVHVIAEEEEEKISENLQTGLHISIQ